MPFEIPEGLNPSLMPIAWMIGRWEGTGKGVYPGTEDFDFGQQIDFAHNGGDYLHYLSQTFEVDAEGLAVKPLSMETGFWRPLGDGTIEVVMCHPDGYAEIWYGKTAGAKVELTTDAVVRTASADEYTAGQRLYGNVEGDLLWTFDKAALGHPLQTHMWARLRRA
ncbi:MAG TPA: FABP family protein [Propionibacteriaceae bacterium]